MISEISLLFGLECKIDGRLMFVKAKAEEIDSQLADSQRAAVCSGALPRRPR